MLFDKNDAFWEKYHMNVKGILYVGAHYGEEYEAFLKMGATKILMFEPTPKSFEVLRLKFNGNPAIKMFNMALGNSKGTMSMYTETANAGQSNSLLKPKQHTQQYPNIVFAGREEVHVDKLDNIKFKRPDYNFLYMDCQGYELEVLRGGIKTLEHVDYILCEVNRAELYEGCAQVDDLDAFLSDFVRVDTNWAGNTWGDAIYISKRALKRSSGEEDIDTNLASLSGEAAFRPHMAKCEPPDNNPIFEEWFFEQHQQHPPTIENRHYLPVFWTSYYNNNKFGQDRKAMQELQDFVDSLDRSKKYYTICQFEDGILTDLKDLDIITFSAFKKDNHKHIPIPLLCQPHAYPSTRGDQKYFASYVGSQNHPIRVMLNKFAPIPGWLIENSKVDINRYCDIIERSTFSLCPRGYGITSFRICEALQFGSIPVYISDKFISPYGLPFEEYGVLVRERDIDHLQQILEAIPPQEIERLKQNGRLASVSFNYVNTQCYIYKQVGLPEKPEKKLAIIIPFRNRLEHLKALTQRLRQLNLPEHKIFVIEQIEGKPFNRGKLLNIGYLLTKDSFDYFVFHDVDMMPDAEVDYGYSESPTHLAGRASQFEHKLPYPEYFGGATMVTGENMEATNGFSNEFWGWGREDDNFFSRCINAKLKIERRNGKFESMAHDGREKVPQIQGTSHDKKDTGLHNCEYKIIGYRQFEELDCITVEI